MEDFFTRYWPVAVFMFGMVGFMAKLYIRNMMLEFSKLTADEMSKEIKELFNMTETAFKDNDRKLKDIETSFDSKLEGLRVEIRYIKDNYVKEKTK